jgi:TonB-dependent receptor
MSQLSVRSAVAEILGSRAPLRRAGAAALLIALSGPAFAQSTGTTAAGASAAAEGTLEEVVVTGIRRSIESAIETKRDSTSIVEAISAEDIGKLPDTSIAESLARLPGLTSQRANGRASAISLRGTDPAFTNALLNGREQVSTGDNRSIEFDQYPSELLSAVVVYKTPDASLVGQGLAGTIDLRTQRPLEYGHRAIAFNVRGERNSEDKLGADSIDKGYRASFSYIDQFFDNKLGLTIGAARLYSPLVIEGVGAYEPWHQNCNTAGCDGFNYHPDVPVGTYVTNGTKVRTDMGHNRRDGALATLEWKPNENFTSTLDAYYTKSNEKDDARSIEFNLGNYPTAVGYSNLNIVDNTLVGATISNVRPLVRNFQFITNDKIAAAGWNNKFTSGDWTLVGDLSWSKATRDQFQPETNAQWGTCSSGGDPACLDSGTFQYFGTSHFPSVTFTQRDYTDPNQVAFGPTIYGAGYVKKPRVTDELKSARIDVTRRIGNWFENVTASLNYSDRTKDKISPEANLNTLQPGAVFIDPQYLLAPTNLGYAGAPNVLAWSVPGVLGAYYQPIAYNYPDVNHSYLIGKAWSVQEKVATFSLRGDLNHELSSAVTLKGNAGIQFIRTDQRSDSFRLNSVTGAVDPFSVGKKYNDILPQINLAFQLPSEQIVRVAVAKEMARPRMDQLKASTEFGADKVSGRPGASGGNPLLDPWRAWAGDVSYEKYWENKAYISVAGFYKKLTSYIYDTTQQNYDFTSLVAQLPPDYFNSGVTPLDFGSFSQPLNGQGGKIYGVELAVSVSGDLFTEALHGFGAQFSISNTHSNINVVDPPSGSNSQITTTGLGTIPLPGLSKTVWNAMVYYENNGFSARVSTRARSKYIGEITNFSNDRAFRFVKGDQITDAQIQYDFSGRFNGLSVLLQGNNLTNEPYVAYAVSEARVIDYQRYGRQFLFGINYKIQ